MDRFWMALSVALACVAGLAVWLAREAESPVEAPEAAEDDVEGLQRDVWRGRSIDELPSGEWLFHEHLDAIGGAPAVRAVENVELLADVEIDGQRFVLRRHATLPHSSQYELRQDRGSVVGGFDGHLAWVDVGLGPLPDFEKSIQEQVRGSDPHYDANYLTHYERFATLGETAFEGTRAYEVRVQTPAGEEETHYFDVESGLRVGRERVQRRPGRPAELLREQFEDYVRYGALRTPRRSTITFLTLNEGMLPQAPSQPPMTVRLRSLRFNLEDLPDIVAPDAVFAALSKRNLRGRVLRGGLPSANAEVVLTPDRDPERTATTRTDAEGRFSFEAVQAMSYAVEAHDGLAYAEAAAILPPGTEANALLLTLEPQAGVRGIVHDASGAPLAGASVGREIESDPQGRFQMRCPRKAGRGHERGAVGCRVSVSKEGYARWCEQVEVRAGEWTELDVELTQQAEASGLLVDARGKPVAGAHVRLEPAQAGSEEGPAPTGAAAPPPSPCAQREDGLATTDAKGRFAFEGQRPGNYLLHAPMRGSPAGLPVQLPAHDLKLALPGRGRVTGRVLNAAGKPLEGADVDLVLERPGQPGAPRDDSVGEVRRQATTGTDGSFRFDALPVGGYSLTATLPESRVEQPVSQEELSLDEGEHAQVVLKANGEQGTLSIRGRVVDGRGEPAAGHLVRARPVVSPEAWGGDGGGSSTTDARGRFAIRALWEGVYALAVAERASAHEVGKPARARAGDGNVRIVVPERTHVSGRVVDAQGTPVQSFVLSGALQGPVSAATGVFSGSAVLDRETHLTVSAPGHGEATVELHGRGGKTLELGDIVLGPARLVRGRVVAADGGEPVPGATLMLLNKAARATADGRFELSGLPAHGAVVWVRAAGYAPLQRALEDDADDVVLELSRGASVTGRALGLDGEPTQDAQVCLACPEHASTCMSDKHPVLEGVAPGTCGATVKLTSGDGGEARTFESRSVEIAEGASVDVELHEVGDPAYLRLVLRDSRGRPVERDVALVAGHGYRLDDADALKNALVHQVARGGESHADDDALLHVAPGPYTVIATREAGERLLLFAHELTLDPGQRLEEPIAIDPRSVTSLPLPGR